ncbi:membrane protein insertion efficiency factor YidD [Falsarthrobacter nasiphocae]|uniref:Putative membrane protein insertion efficiency factor n=1 Tax=Falsarthrobacter nasiphocae TaxID=189863 RepID=A0AAE3YHF5_9MICC|nr:membrane protein insertion efficiency factor YidD [Falsarthrobacter nasiphocae]MDR6892076.1 putative membrane protein insertion efficiency factor [Falsarthrobacter nasiphocae]
MNLRRSTVRAARFVVDLPRLVLIGLLKAYRAVISPLYGPVCRFYPSCTAYALEAVTVHGAVKGSGLTAWRVLRCNPFNPGGVDHVPRGTRRWTREKLPRIVVLNHARIDDYIDGQSAAKEQ